MLAALNRRSQENVFSCFEDHYQQFSFFLYLFLSFALKSAVDLRRLAAPRLWCQTFLCIPFKDPGACFNKHPVLLVLTEGEFNAL